MNLLIGLIAHAQSAKIGGMYASSSAAKHMDVLGGCKKKPPKETIREKDPVIVQGIYGPL